MGTLKQPPPLGRIPDNVWTFPVPKKVCITLGTPQYSDSSEGWYNTLLDRAYDAWLMLSEQEKSIFENKPCVFCDILNNNAKFQEFMDNRRGKKAGQNFNF